MRNILGRAAFAGIVILAFNGCVLAAADASGSSILEPAAGALLGLYYGTGNLSQTTAKLGRTPPVHLTYYAWTDDWTGTVTKADLAAGRIPLVNWEPHKINFTKIVDGSLDATIVARANGSKALGKKFFLDFAAEMNGDEAWGGNNAPLYVAAYRHIHDIFVAGIGENVDTAGTHLDGECVGVAMCSSAQEPVRSGIASAPDFIFVAAGATNVIWAWCPNVTDINGGNKNTMDYYPGDAYVDWTGVDGYNWGTTNGGWQTFQQVFREIYPLLAARKKPIMIGEMSSAQVGGDKAKWIDEIIPTLRASFPLIKCLIWFDINKEADWRISSSPESEAAFIRMVNDPYFNP